MPNLTNVALSDEMFNNPRTWCVFSTKTVPYSWIDVGALESCPQTPIHNPDARVRYLEDWTRLEPTIACITIDHGCCNDETITSLDFARFGVIEEIVIGSTCCRHVGELKIVGLSRLRRIDIGSNCCTETERPYKENPNHPFVVKDCPMLRTLKIGTGSFKDYTTCEIENNDNLESIQIGATEASNNTFARSSLSVSARVTNRPPEAEGGGSRRPDVRDPRSCCVWGFDWMGLMIE